MWEVANQPLKTGTFSLVTSDLAQILEYVEFFNVAVASLSSVYSITNTWGIASNKRSQGLSWEPLQPPHWNLCAIQLIWEVKSSQGNPKAEFWILPLVHQGRQPRTDSFKLTSFLSPYFICLFSSFLLSFPPFFPPSFFPSLSAHFILYFLLSFFLPSFLFYFIFKIYFTNIGNVAECL